MVSLLNILGFALTVGPGLVLNLKHLTYKVTGMMRRTFRKNRKLLILVGWVVVLLMNIIGRMVLV